MANGGIIGPNNVTSFGKNKVTSITSTGPTSPALAATNSGTRLVKALIVAGGGGGGDDASAGGGGGGTRNLEIETKGNIALGEATVGGGGAGAPAYCTAGSSGTDSSLVVCGTTYTSTGGGGGGSGDGGPGGIGRPGGSGGGGHGASCRQ